MKKNTRMHILHVYVSTIHCSIHYKQFKSIQTKQTCKYTHVIIHIYAHAVVCMHFTTAKKSQALLIFHILIMMLRVDLWGGGYVGAEGKESMEGVDVTT